MNLYAVFRVEPLHEVEVGSWKALLIHIFFGFWLRRVAKEFRSLKNGNSTKVPAYTH